MGTKSSDDAALYKPTDAESGYASKVNNCFDRVGRLTTQVKLFEPIEWDLSVVNTAHVVTTGQLSPNARWSLGASNRFEFSELNAELAEAPDRTGHYVHYMDYASEGLTLQSIGADEYGENPMALCAIWEPDPDNPLEYVIVCSFMVNVSMSEPPT